MVTWDIAMPRAKLPKLPREPAGKMRPSAGTKSPGKKKFFSETQPPFAQSLALTSQTEIAKKMRWKVSQDRKFSCLKA
jgi:hypothetical protein